ncbi:MULTISPECIES: hypothetical protein [unclassified Spirillospora]|uniref:hypothetical protein n=1 Tax=unclassified Spirillospora TaxID=2642701 RepID=UPI00371FD97C
MLQRTRGFGRVADRGASAAEYGAVLLVAAVVVGVLVSSPVMDTASSRIGDALCKLFGGECESGTPSGPPALSACTVHQGIDQTTTGRKVILFGDQDSHSAQVDSNADGSIVVTTSNSSGSGIDLEAGLGGRVGGTGWGVSVGGGVLWTGENQQQVTVQNQEELEEYQGRLQRRGTDLIEEHGGIWEMLDDEDAMAELEEMPLQIAEEMDLPAMIINADGTNAFVEVDGSVGSDVGDTGLSGSLRHEESRLLGTSESIEPGGERVHGEYYAATDTDTARLGVELTPSPVLGAGREISYERVGGNVIHVEYDENGDPKKITAVNTSEWRFGAGGSLQLGFETDRGGGGAGGGVMVENGDVTVNTTTIEIPPDQRGEVADELRGIFDDDFAGRIEGALTIEELADGPNVTTTQQLYNATGHTVQGGAELDLVIEWFDFNSSHSERNMTLDEAHYVDPATGEWRRWYSCERGGD